MAFKSIALTTRSHICLLLHCDLSFRIALLRKNWQRAEFHRNPVHTLNRQTQLTTLSAGLELAAGHKKGAGILSALVFVIWV